jgi:hypothetical protein
MVVLAAALAGGCANSGLDLSTASISPDKNGTLAKSDPVCVSLATQISTIRGDGTIDRLEKAADGKSSKVEVKRTALQKQAELNKANADFLTRCGPAIPAQAAAQQPATTTASAAAPAKTAAATTKAAASSEQASATPASKAKVPSKTEEKAQD